MGMYSAFKLSGHLLIVSIAIVLIAMITAGTLFAQSDRSFANQSVSKLPSKEKRWALIVGVNNFGLKGAENDARALKNALMKYSGFSEEHIILLTTDARDPENIPTKNNIIFALDKLSSAIPKDGMFLFAFSGHGKTIGGDAYVVPSDGQVLGRPELMQQMLLNSSIVKEMIVSTKVKQVLMFLDSCRDQVSVDGGRGNAAQPLTSAYSRGFSFDDVNKDIDAYVTFYGTKKDDFSYEYRDDETNQWRGYFSRAIEEGLSGKAANDKGEVTLGKLVEYVQNAVPSRVWAQKHLVQNPWKSGDGFLESDLVLGIVEKPRNDSGDINAKSAEAAFWNAIENSSEIADFENYLNRCERGEFNGTYQSTAELKLQRLKRTNAPAAWSKFQGIARKLMKYRDIGSMSEGLAWADFDGHHGFIDGFGNEVIPATYEGFPFSFSDGLARVFTNDSNRGYIDKRGRLVFTTNYGTRGYGNGGSFSEGLADVRLGDTSAKYGFVDKTGKTVIPFIYDSVTPFSGGLAVVSVDGKYKTINIDGKEVAQLNYEYVGGFSEGLATFSNVKGATNEIGLIDNTGKKLVLLPYDWVDSFSEGIAIVGKAGKQGYIDKRGREIVPLIYEPDECNIVYSQFSNGVAQVILNGKFGFIDSKGKEIIPPKYQTVWCRAFLKDGFVGVTLNGKKGFVDFYGNEYFDF
jgi:hypothetical protein